MLESVVELGTQEMDAIRGEDGFELLSSGLEKTLSGDHYGLNSQSLPSSPRFYKSSSSLMTLREEEVSFGNRLS